MAVAITPKWTQHTGLAQSAEGSVAAWLVTFELDGDDSIHVAIPVRIVKLNRKLSKCCKFF
jgi:hypothetical protein